MKYAFLLLAASAWTGWSCSSENTAPDHPVDRLEITLAPSRPVYPVHDTVLASMAGFDSHGARVPTGLKTWRSLDPSLVTVSDSGLIRMLAPGTATIEVASDGLTAQVQLVIRGLLHTANITTSQTWAVADTPHVVHGIVGVGSAGNVTLTIEAGSRVLFRSQSGLDIGDTDFGRLVIRPGGPAVRMEGDSAGVGTWLGVYFRGPGQSELRNVTFRHCGQVPLFGSASGCIGTSVNNFQQGPNLLLEDVTIEGPHQVGLTLSNWSTFAPGSHSFSVLNGDGHIATINPEAAGHFPPGGQLTGNAENEIWIGSGPIEDTTTWVDPGVPWRVVGSVVISTSQTPLLTIPAGLEIRMDPGAGFNIGNNGRGSLVIGDSAGPPILLESTGMPWAGVTVDDGGRLISFTQVEFRNCSPCIAVSGGTGAGNRLHVKDVTITGAVSDGLSLGLGARFDSASGNLTVTGASGAPVALWADAVSSLPYGQYQSNGIDAIRVTGSAVTQTASWRNPGVPYLVGNGMGIGDGANDPVLTLEPGVILHMGIGTMVGVGEGALHAVGTPAEPIIFTSVTPGVPGSWVGIELGTEADSRTRLDHVEIQDAGAGQSGIGGAVRFFVDPGGVLRNTTIVRSVTCGLLLFGPSWAEDYENPAFGNAFMANLGPPRCVFP